MQAILKNKKPLGLLRTADNSCKAYRLDCHIMDARHKLRAHYNVPSNPPCSFQRSFSFWFRHTLRSEIVLVRPDAYKIKSIFVFPQIRPALEAFYYRHTRSGMAG